MNICASPDVYFMCYSWGCLFLLFLLFFCFFHSFLSLNDHQGNDLTKYVINLMFHLTIHLIFYLLFANLTHAVSPNPLRKLIGGIHSNLNATISHMDRLQSMPSSYIYPICQRLLSLTDRFYFSLHYRLVTFPNSGFNWLPDFFAQPSFKPPLTHSGTIYHECILVHSLASRHR